MEKIINTRAIQVIVNNKDLNTEGNPYYDGRNILINESLDDDCQYLVMLDGIKANVAEISTIESQFVQLILNDYINNGKRGIAINMLSEQQKAYIKVPASELDEWFIEPTDEVEGIKLRDYTMRYIEDGDNTMVEIAHKQYPEGRIGTTKFEEIVEWAIKYGLQNVSIQDEIRVEVDEETL